MGIKILKLVAACSLLIFLSSCGGGGSSTPAAAVDTSPTMDRMNEQATLINVAKTVTLYATDTTYNQALSFTATSSSSSVTPAIFESTLTLTPAYGWTGTSTISVKAYDGISYSAAKTFTFTACASACAPVLNFVDGNATTVNTAKNITLAGTDANSDSLTYSATSDDANVVPSISGTTLTLTPATDWTGTATISAKASDAALDSSVKTFTFKVCATACLPTLASVSTQTTTEDNAKAVTLVGADPESDALTYTATSSTTNVTTTISGSTLTLNPKLNWSGSATITAKVADGDDLSATRAFTLTTSAVNDAPVLESITNKTTNEEVAKTLLLNATDVEADSLTYSATSSNSSNVTTGISGTTLTLTPTANFAGTVTITAKANDGTVDSAAKTFTLTVSNVNDAPVVGTVANQTTAEDTAKTVTLSETDVDTGDSHTFTATSSTANVTPSISGSTLTMTPAANWSGTATITIKANDGTVDSAAKTFTLTVSAVNDIPVLASIANQSTGEDNAKVITLSATDVEGSSLTYSATSSASQITIGVSGTTLTMTPDNDWSGTSTITAKANDGTAYSVAKTFTLTVSGSNDTPVIGSVSTQTTNEDTAKAVTLSVSDSDSGDSHTYYATSSSTSVTPSISGATLTLTPAANFNGNSTITIKANDGTVYSIAKTFTLTVSAVNDAPVLASISNQSTLEDTAKAVTLSGSDIDGDSMTYSATTSESEITISVSGTTLTMTPDNDWSGTSTITAKANDGTVDSAAKTFTLTVSGSNDAPIVANISNQSTNEDAAKAITLSASDADGDSLTYSATSSASQITISVSSTTLTMTPDANWNGTSTISVKANDGLVDSAAKTFTLTVSAVNDAPTLAAVVHQDTNENVAKVVTLSGTDTEGSSLTYSATSSTTNVGIGVSGANLTLTPASNWVGTATITAKVNDGTVDSATKSFTIESWNLETIPLLIVGVEYANATFTNNAATWATKIFGTSEGQLNHYMSEISGGRMQFTQVTENSGTANDSIMIAAFSKNHPNYGKTASLADQEAIMTHFVNNINYAAYDTNSDGYISVRELQVMFIVAGGESSYGTSPGVWGHAWCENYYPYTLDGVQFFNCNYGRFSRFGERHGNHDATIGIIAHELGHAAFLITDLYDSDNSSEGIGELGLMGAASWGTKNSSEHLGSTPAHPTGFTKIKMGFLDPTTISADGTYTANASSNSFQKIYKIETGVTNEYFLVENRHAVGYDLGLGALAGTSYSYAGGLLITHIDEDISVNSNEDHKRIDIEEANNAGLDDKTDRGHINNLYFNGNSTTFNNSSTPNSKNIAGSATNISITGISNKATNMTFTVDIP